jgi:hypothetical protein
VIKVGERVECVDQQSPNFGKKGYFIGFLANGFKIKFDDGSSELFLASDLKIL